ncbi:hypothetical protein [Sutcliffiella horikoshii]|uniref:hypothetical protein n=1 Tax=Sutcliffiella horikoshii TaxID=79883 RepID=UPI001F475174|nr:hypothetical protein [Sutcliffiella horikoshii]MCG1020824.1 hypothetical protein [Sutcliffiella horikoshii]
MLREGKNNPLLIAAVELVEPSSFIYVQTEKEWWRNLLTPRTVTMTPVQYGFSVLDQQEAEGK